IIQHYQNKVRGVRDLEKALSDHGKQVGSRLFEVLALRERSIKRETKVLNVLYFLQATVWKSLFGRAADSIEKSTSSEDEYMIIDADPLVTRYVNVPREMGGALSCAAFVAGIIEAIMTASLCPCVVTAHTVPIEGKRQPNRTVYLIKLDQEVMNREQQLK
ncbi:TRAPP I complex, partial [Ramicandelaber brevisporus]